MKRHIISQLEDFDQNFEEDCATLFTPFTTKSLEDAKNHYAKRKPHVVAMKRKVRWSTEDVRQAFNYNEHNFKLIDEFKIVIGFLEKFILWVDESNKDEATKALRISFCQDCIMKLHRIIAIYKATIMTA